MGSGVCLKFIFFLVLTYDFNFGYSYTFEMVDESSQYLLARTHHRPRIGIICGSGLGECQL